METTLSYIFAVPDSAAESVISAGMLGLPILGQGDALNTIAGECENLSFGDFHASLDAVMKTLKRDYDQNLAEADDVIWTFDYSVVNYELTSHPKIKGLAIYTRLRGPNPRHGMIHYGQRIFRLDANHFACDLE